MSQMRRGCNLWLNIAMIGAGLGIAPIYVVMLGAELGIAVVLRGDIEALLLGG